MIDFKPGDLVIYKGERRIIIDIADYRDEDDGGEQVVMATLRRLTGDPNRKLDEDGGDIDIWATPISELEKA